MGLRYKNYIFDFGKVIVEFEPEVMLSPYIADNSDRELAGKVVFDRIYWDKLDAGTITDDEVIAAISARLPERLREPAIAAYQNWYRNLPLIDGMCELIEKIKNEGGKLFLLSNISKGFAENYASVEEFDRLFSLFDGLVFSGPLGKIKPDTKIFNHLLDTYGILPEDSIFIDDNASNIMGAKSVNINGYLFNRDIENLEKELFLNS